MSPTKPLELWYASARGAPHGAAWRRVAPHDNTLVGPPTCMKVLKGDTMARVVRFDHYGGRDVLYIADVEVPAPPSGEVVVAVRAAGINPGEAAIRTGALAQRFPATFPSGEGSDLAGVISAVGDGVTGFAVGDAVLGWSWRRSSHADYVAVPVTH